MLIEHLFLLCILYDAWPAALLAEVCSYPAVPESTGLRRRVPLAPKYLSAHSTSRLTLPGYVLNTSSITPVLPGNCNHENRNQESLVCTLTPEGAIGLVELKARYVKRLPTGFWESCASMKDYRWWKCKGGRQQLTQQKERDNVSG